MSRRCQVATRLTDVQGRAKRAGDVINDVTRSAGKGVGDMTETLMLVRTVVLEK